MVRNGPGSLRETKSNLSLRTAPPPAMASYQNNSSESSIPPVHPRLRELERRLGDLTGMLIMPYLSSRGQQNRAMQLQRLCQAASDGTRSFEDIAREVNDTNPLFESIREENPFTCTFPEQNRYPPHLRSYTKVPQHSFGFAFPDELPHRQSLPTLFDKYNETVRLPQGSLIGNGLRSENALKSPEAYTQPYCEFMTNNPTIFHAVDAFEKDLTKAGFKKVCFATLLVGFQLTST